MSFFDFSEHLACGRRFAGNDESPGFMEFTLYRDVEIRDYLCPFQDVYTYPYKLLKLEGFCAL